MKRHGYMFIVVGFIFLILGSLILFIDSATRYECVKFEKIVSIESVNYREATFVTETGDRVTLSQATKKPGDLICVKSEKIQK